MPPSPSLGIPGESSKEKRLYMLWPRALERTAVKMGMLENFPNELELVSASS
jgi:hypothetical protein